MSITESIVNINGTLLKGDEAKISVFDRGFLLGDSVYEVTRTYESIPFLLKEHLDRLWRSAEQISLPISYSPEQIKVEIDKCIKELAIPNIYLRIIITRGSGEIGLDPDLSPTNNLVIIAKEQLEYPKWWYEQGVSFVVANTLRNPKNSLDPNIKSGNYLNNVMAYMEAKKLGAFDAIMLNQEGHVTEGTTSNIWIVKNNILKTPPPKAGLLMGITRHKLIELAKNNKINIKEENFDVDELLNAEEAFLTSSTKEIVPITKINNKEIGNGMPGKVTNQLRKIYSDFVKEDLSKY